MRKLPRSIQNRPFISRQLQEVARGLGIRFASLGRRSARAIAILPVAAVGLAGWAQLASAPQPNSGSTPAAPTGAGAYDQKPIFGPHHRIHLTRQHAADRNGKLKETEARYLEVQTGLLYFEQGGWWKSKEEIELREHHAVAYRAPHKVTFQANINRFAVVHFVSPEGKEMGSHVLGLSYYDAASGRSALIAELKDSLAKLVPPNQLVYEDAFTDFKADVRYTYTKAGLEQDVILRELPPAPEEYGLSSETTRLEILTEFILPPVPKIEAKKLKEEKDPKRRAAMADPDLVDQTLDFGSMMIGLGKAFYTPGPDEAQTAPDTSNGKGARAGPLVGKKTAPVAKRWAKLDGRQFLIETVEYAELKAQMDAVAPGNKAKPETPVRRNASLQRFLPKIPAGSSPKDAEKIQVASLPYSPKGLVLDYSIVSTIPNFTFQAGTTYHLNGEVYLSGTTTIEDDAVLKFGAGAALRVLGAFNSPKRSACLTAENDHAVGVTVPARSAATLYGAPALGFHNLPSGTTIKNLDIRYASVGLENYSPQARHTVDGCRFFKCETGADVFGASLTLQNSQMTQVKNPHRNLGGGAEIATQNLISTSPRPADREVSLKTYDDHGNSTGSATYMGSSDSRSGSIDYYGDEDYFRVDISSYGTLSAYTTGSTDTYGYLLDSGGNSLTSNDDNPYPNFSFSYSVSPGTYYIRVRHYSYSGTGSYTLNTSFSSSGGGYDDYGNSMGSATVLSPNSSASGAINYAGDVDYFRVDVGSSGTLTAYTTGSTDTYGYLLDSGGSTLTYNDDNPYPNFRFSYSVSAGTYYVQVRHYSSGGTGSYTLYVEFSASAQAPSAPTGLGISAGNGTIYLSWASVSGAYGYYVYRSTGGSYSYSGSTSSTSYTDSGLAAGTTYSYYLTAYNSAGQSSYSSSVSATTAPNPPTGLSASAGSGYVSLSWSASSGAYNYSIKRSTSSGGPYSTIQNTTSTYYTDSSVAPGTTYYYVVSATSISGAEGYNSGQVSVTTPASPPSAPAWLSASPGIQQIYLWWPSSSGATYYNLKRWNGSAYATIASPTDTTYIDTGLPVNSSYLYVVSAANGSGQSADSSAASATTAPAAPVGVGASGGTYIVTVSWFWVSGASTYRVKRLSGSGGSVVATFTTSNTTYTDSGLPSGATFYYVVSAVNSSGTESPNSSQVSATTTPPDSDGDGLPDSWETQYFGNLSQGPGGDYDGDGVTNFQEYQSGTNPTIANVTIRIARPRNGSNFP